MALDSVTFRSHIDRCLGCRACEAACPSGVEYGHLLEAARINVEAARPSGITSILKRFVLRNIWPFDVRRRAVMWTGLVLRGSGVGKFLIASRVVRLFSLRADLALRLLETTRPARLGITATDGEDKRPERNGSAAVFCSCTTDLQPSVDAAVRRVLQINGIDTSTPRGATCCGALHAHAGFIEEARDLARRNIDAFEGTAGPIVTSAGGCGAMLVDYGHLLASDTEYRDRAVSFAERVKDVGQVLQDPRRVVVTSSAERVAYDASCHLLYGQHAAEDSVKMLSALDDLTIAPLQHPDVCCGGAGIYNLLEPELSTAVLDRKIEDINSSGATLVATANAGCHMQISYGLAREGGNTVRVCHPVEILDEGYRSAGLYSDQDD